jgi:hypothetical protein
VVRFHPAGSVYGDRIPGIAAPEGGFALATNERGNSLAAMHPVFVY